MKATITTIHLLGAAIALNIRGLPTLIILIKVFAVLGIIDVITGYIKNPVEKRKSNILSRGIWVRFAKILLCVAFFVLTAHASVLLPDYTHIIGSIPLVLLFGRVLSELKSISENMIDMGYNDPIFQSLPELVDTMTGLGKDAIIAVFNSAIAKMTKYVNDKDPNKKDDLSNNQPGA